MLKGDLEGLRGFGGSQVGIKSRPGIGFLVPKTSLNYKRGKD